MSDIDLSEAVEAACEKWALSNPSRTGGFEALSHHRQALLTGRMEQALEAALPYILSQIPEYIPPTSPKPGTRWQYGVSIEELLELEPMVNRAAAERSIKRQRTAPRSHQILTKKLVRRLVSDWEDVK